MNRIPFKQIGVIHSPFKVPEGTPIQPSAGKEIEGNKIRVKDLDIMDGTPLLDIKPYVREFDKREAIKLGWLEKNLGRFVSEKDDGRFVK